MPFLPREIVPAVVEAAAAALRPGGWLLPGTFAGPPDPLSKLLVDLRTVRAGGHPWDGADLVDEIARHGLEAAHEVPRTWTAPVHLMPRTSLMTVVIVATCGPRPARGNDIVPSPNR